MMDRLSSKSRKNIVVTLFVVVTAAWLAHRWRTERETLITRWWARDGGHGNDIDQETTLTPLAESRHTAGHDGYVWPSRYDHLEDLYALKTGYFTNLLSDEISPCSQGDPGKSRQTAAEWIRAAFHDAIAHSAVTGQDGLDASLVFELDRPGNAETKVALQDTLHFLGLLHSLRASMSDLLALAVYVAVANCNGPRIAFRAGRVDATQAGTLEADLPMPEQDLAVHKAMFARAGFDTADMIALVACGHTLGGVHGEAFPAIAGPALRPTGNPPVLLESAVAHFDKSPHVFDNAPVLEFLQRTSASPLVIHNDNNTTTTTTSFASDARIFAADASNATLRTLAEPTGFLDRCAAVLGRLIDTVPRDAEKTLTRPFEAIDIKPYIREHALFLSPTTGDLLIRLSGRVRVRFGPNTPRPPPVGGSLQVKLVLRGRDASATTTTTVVDAVRGSKDGGTSQGHFGDAFAWFEFGAAVPASAGTLSFDVHVVSTLTGEREVHDNGGRGFPVPDGLLYQPRLSCLDSTVRNGTMHLRVVCAVRKRNENGNGNGNNGGLEKPPRLEITVKTPREGVVVPTLQVVEHLFRPWQEDEGEGDGDGDGLYRLYRVDVDLPVASWNTRFDLVGGDDTVRVEFLPTNVLRSASVCQDSLI